MIYESNVGKKGLESGIESAVNPSSSLFLHLGYAYAGNRLVNLTRCEKVT